MDALSLVVASTGPSCAGGGKLGRRPVAYGVVSQEAVPVVVACPFVSVGSSYADYRDVAMTSGDFLDLNPPSRLRLPPVGRGG